MLSGSITTPIRKDTQRACVRAVVRACAQCTYLGEGVIGSDSAETAVAAAAAALLYHT